MEYGHVSILYLFCSSNAMWELEGVLNTSDNEGCAPIHPSLSPSPSLSEWLSATAKAKEEFCPSSSSDCHVVPSKEKSGEGGAAAAAAARACDVSLRQNVLSSSPASVSCFRAHAVAATASVGRVRESREGTNEFENLMPLWLGLGKTLVIVD